MWCLEINWSLQLDRLIIPRHSYWWSPFFCFESYQDYGFFFWIMWKLRRKVNSLQRTSVRMTSSYNACSLRTQRKESWKSSCDNDISPWKSNREIGIGMRGRGFYLPARIHIITIITKTCLATSWGWVKFWNAPPVRSLLAAAIRKYKWSCLLLPSEERRAQLP